MSNTFVPNFLKSTNVYAPNSVPRHEVLAEKAIAMLGGLGLNQESSSAFSQYFAQGAAGLDHGIQQEMARVTQNINTGISTISGADLNGENFQIEAGESVVLGQVVSTVSAPKAYLEGNQHKLMGGKQIISMVDGAPAFSIADQGNLQTEAFEPQKNMTTMQVNLSYNLYGVNNLMQSRAAELFLPIINMGATDEAYIINLNLLTVYRDQMQTVQPNPWAKDRSLLHSLRDSSILRAGYTDLIPIVRKGKTDDHFVDETILPTIDYNFNGETLKTSYLKIGRTVNLLQLIERDGALAQGQANVTRTYQIGPNPRLGGILMQISDDDAVRFDKIGTHVSSGFTTSNNANQNQGDVTIGYSVNTHVLNADTVSAKNGQFPTALDVLKTQKLEVSLHVGISGTGNTVRGDFTLSSPEVTIKRIVKTDTQEEVDLASATANPIKDLVKEFKVIGWYPEMQLSNMNNAEHGLVLDSNVQKLTYGVKLNSPISIRRPTHDMHTNAPSNVEDWRAITENLINVASYVRSNQAIDTIYNVLEQLKQMPKGIDVTEPYSHTVFGAGQYYVDVVHRDLELDVFDKLQSLDTKDKTENVNALISQLMTVVAADMYARSGMAAIYEITGIARGEARPHVIAIADPFTHKFVFRDADTRTLGNGFDFTIAECSDRRLTKDDKTNADNTGNFGTIFMSFGKPKQGELSVPLYFGNTLRKHEVIRSVQRSIANTTVIYDIMQPFSNPVVHTPILARIRIRNLAKALEEKTPFQTKNA